MSSSSKRPRRASRRSSDFSDPAIRRAAASGPTPRNSGVAEDIRTLARETPYANLRQLAGIIQKPSTPSQSTNYLPSSNKRSNRRPVPLQDGSQSYAVTDRRNTPNRRVATASTPHAIRALQQRRAGQTPGRDRRRSGRAQRETPRDVLRALSQVLATTTEPFEPTPPQQLPVEPVDEEDFSDDLEDEADPPRPRLSLPLDDDDSPQATPPVLSEPPEDEENNNTEISIELPRRALGHQASNSRSRGSFGSIRLSDRFVDFNDLGLADETELAADESLVAPDFGGDDSDGVEQDQTDLFDINEQSATVNIAGAFAGDEDEAALDPALEEMVDDILLEDAGESTFVFDVPSEKRDLGTEESATSVHARRAQKGKTSVANIETDKPSKKLRPLKVIKKSKFGIPCPSIPAATVKKMALNFSKTSSGRKSTLSKDTLAAIVQASDWFFEQVSDDLAAYAEHAGRRTIEESDMITLMKRQRQLTANTTPFSLAQRFLPGELLHDIHMSNKVKSRRKRSKLRAIEEEEDDEG